MEKPKNRVESSQADYWGISTCVDTSEKYTRASVPTHNHFIDGFPLNKSIQFLFALAVTM